MGFKIISYSKFQPSIVFVAAFPMLYFIIEYALIK